MSSFHVIKTIWWLDSDCGRPSQFLLLVGNNAIMQYVFGLFSALISRKNALHDIYTLHIISNVFLSKKKKGKKDRDLLLSPVFLEICSTQDMVYVQFSLR